MTKKKKVVSCHYCMKKFTSIGHMWRHEKLKHPNRNWLWEDWRTDK